MKRLGKFIKHGPGERRLLAETFLWLLLAKVALRCLPFRSVAKRLGSEGEETPETAGAGEDDAGRSVGWAVERVVIHSPLGFLCLQQAIAAKWMLGRRGVRSTLYLGLRKQESSLLKAHAWLRVGSRIVTGKAGMREYRVIATYGDAIPGTAEPN